MVKVPENWARLMPTEKRTPRTKSVIIYIVKLKANFQKFSCDLKA